MGEVKLLCGELNLISGRRIKITFFTEEILKILATEANLLLLFGLASDYFLDEVFQNPWEFIRYFNLFGCEDSHLFDVRHFI